MAGRPEPGDLLRVRIDRIGARANAVASVDGFTLLVPRGVVGEQAEVGVVDHLVEREDPAELLGRFDEAGAVALVDRIVVSAREGTLVVAERHLVMHGRAHPRLKLL